MAIKRLEENVEIVQTLGIYPNQEDDLSAAELQEKFDEGARIIKDYLNEEVVPAVQELEARPDGSEAVRFTPQGLSAEQQAQVRRNIGAAKYGEYSLYIGNDETGIESEIAVAAEHPVLNEENLIDYGRVGFYETHNDAPVQLVHIADGTEANHAATVGQVRSATDEKFFEVTADGEVSLKDVYRGAFPSYRNPENFPGGVSDNDKDVAGSKNAELPKNIVIPNTVGGVNVTSIAGGAFAGNLMIESISIPDAVKEIPDHCFENCYNLKSVHAVGVEHIRRLALSFTGIEVADFPEVTSIGSSAFAKAHVKKVNLPKLELITDETAFDHCLELETVNVGNLTTVPMATFWGCCNLQTVSCDDDNDGITSIGLAAFAVTPKLTTVKISPAATDIQAYAFYVSGFEYDWKTLTGCTFGVCATSRELNPTDIWTGLTIKECENPLPTLFNQKYTGWADRVICTTEDKIYYYRSGCVLFAFIHAYCGLEKMKLESVEDFESIANSYQENILGSFKQKMEKTYPVFCPAFGLTCEPGKINGKEDLQKIYDALADGKYVIVEFGSGVANDYKGLEGHVALIYGVRKDGKLLVAESDPGNDDLHGKTYAIHFKNFLHTDTEDENVDATDYYIISNGEPTMSTIDDKLEDVLKSVAVRVVSGSFTLNESTGVYTIAGVPTNAKLVEVNKVGDPTNSNSAKQIFAYHVVYTNAWRNAEKGGTNAFAEYMGGNQYKGTFIHVDYPTDNGLTIDLGFDGVLQFEANAEYEWNAYCVND